MTKTKRIKTRTASRIGRLPSYSVPNFHAMTCAEMERWLGYSADELAALWNCEKSEANEIINIVEKVALSKHARMLNQKSIAVVLESEVLRRLAHLPARLQW